MLSIATDDPENGQPLWVCERIKVGQIFANEQEDQHSQRVRKRRLAVERWKKRKKKKRKTIVGIAQRARCCSMHCATALRPNTQETTGLSREQDSFQPGKENWMKKKPMPWNRSLLCGRRQGGWTTMKDREKRNEKKKENVVWDSSSLQLPDRAVFADARNRRNPHLWNEYTGPTIPPHCGWTWGHSSDNGRLFWNDIMYRYNDHTIKISTNIWQCNKNVTRNKNKIKYKKSTKTYIAKNQRFKKKTNLIKYPIK